MSALTKVDLLRQADACLAESRKLNKMLETATPQAKQLLVHKEIEKLIRQAEKAKAGLQELIL